MFHDDILKNDLPSFIGKALQTCDPGAGFVPSRHIDMIAHYLEQARLGEIRRLIINMPPRALKSICVSVAWPAWILGHDPSARIMAASYAGALAREHSIDTRLVVTSDWYRRIFPDTALARDQNEKHKFMTTARGFRLATSVGGSTTGEGGNFLILDDPINPAHAMNARWRNHVNEWFGHTFASRLDDKRKGVIVLVMQRLHPDDLSGFLLRQGGWEHLCLPAVARKNDPYRHVGELLQPARENMTDMERTKRELGSVAFAAQYQQDPVPDDAGMVKRSWFGRYKVAPTSMDRMVQSWDTAIKATSSADASVCLTFAENAGRSYLLDVCVVRKEYPDLKRMLYAMAEQWKPHAILIEDRASGQQLLQDMRRESHLPVIAMNPKYNKTTRFAAVSALMEAGKVVLPERAPWLADFERELVEFPGGSHDDQVDALTQYLDWLRGQSFSGMGIRSV